MPHIADDWDAIHDWINELIDDGECAVPRRVIKAMKVLDEDIFEAERADRDG